MAEGMSKYLEENVLKGSVNYKGEGFKAVTKAYLALCQAEVKPGESGTEIEEQTAGKAKEFKSSEKKYENYARIEIVNTEWEFSGENPVKMVNKAIVKFAAAGAGTVATKCTYVALCDALTGGNVLYYTKVTEFEVTATAKEVEAAAKAVEFTLK